MPHADGGGPVWVVLLGPVGFVADGRLVAVPRAQARGVLAWLALHPGQQLGYQSIVEAMWGGAAPEKARGQVHSAVSAIRGLLERIGRAEVLESNRFGYRLNVPPGVVDVGRFDELAAEARKAGTAEPWREALSLFQGEPLADAAGAYVEAIRAGIDERRMAAVEELAEVELRLGNHAGVAAELLPMLEAYPHRERLRGKVMLALHGSGRQAEALNLYRSYRKELSERDGLDPGRELAELAVEILREKPAPQKAAQQAPAMLPAGGRVFRGRAAYLARLDDLAATGGVVAIDGAAGVGKTELALHWARRTQQEFPDGKLYVNLRGYGSGPILSPMEALSRLLFALGTPPSQLPLDLDDAMGLYRTLVADRRLLVLLDNAHNADQIRPLLPGHGNSFIVVTSRARLTGLTVSDGAQTISLGVLDPVESRDLLRSLLNNDDPAIGELAELCSGLPLALRIAAAAVTGRGQSVARYVEDLRSGGTLAKLEIPGDHTIAVRRAFDSSFTVLPPSVARLFALLGLAPAHDLSLPAMTALAGTACEPMLSELIRMHLVDETGPGRYSMHDLLRLYARERAAELIGNREGLEAVSILLLWYLEQARAAAEVLYPETLRLPAPGTEHRPTAAEALAFLRDEEPNLVTLVSHAAAHGPHPVAAQLADALRAYMSSRASTSTWLAVASHGLAAAQKANDALGEVASCLSLGHLYLSSGRYQESIEWYQRVLSRAREAGWREAEGAALGNLGTVNARLCRLDQAVEHHEQALSISTEMGEHARQAVILGNLGGIRHRQGRLAEAAERMGQSLALHRKLGNAGGQALQLNNLGIVLRELGRFDLARRSLEEALAVYRSMDNAAGTGMVLCSLADLHRDGGALRQALDLAEQALAMPELTGNEEHVACALNSAGTVHLLLSHIDDSLDCHRRAHVLANEVGNRELEAESLLGLAAALTASGRANEATRNAREALAIGRQTGHGLVEGLALTALADSQLAAGDPAMAEETARAALAIHLRNGHHCGTAATQRILANAAQMR